VNIDAGQMFPRLGGLYTRMHSIVAEIPRQFVAEAVGLLGTDNPTAEQRNHAKPVLPPP
jgi:hypothetical protein